MTSTIGSVQYGARTITYAVQLVARKTVAIDVYPDQRVEIRAPLDAPLERVAATVRQHARWIARQQRYFAEYPADAQPRAYVSGESYRYLGRQYRLKVQRGAPIRVLLQHGRLQVTVPANADSTQVEQAVKTWYRSQAQRIFRERLDACFARVTALELPYPPLELRAMKKRWGSCSRTGVIRLNPRLIQAPRSCIDYVIMHELCHLKAHNHSKRYYALLDRALPEWREVRQKLNTIEFL
jgi:predicted metal-dependent hydrolase